MAGAPFSLVDIVKAAKDAGIEPGDIQTIVAHEENRYKSELDRVEKQKEKEAEREERHRDRELRKLELEAEEATKKRQHELELARLNVGNRGSVVNPSRSAFPDLKLPNFNDDKDDINDYLNRFEKIAELQKWEVDRYHIYLGAHLTGRALKTYINLPNDELSNYELVKDALLKTFCLDADSFRRKFRESKVKDDELYVQLITRMDHYLKRWLSLSEVKNDYDDLFTFLIRDQLLSNCPLDMRIFLKERLFNNTREMAHAADLFKSAHRSVKLKKTIFTKEETSKKSDNDSKSDVVCHHFKSKGHIRPNCPELKRS